MMNFYWHFVDLQGNFISTVFLPNEKLQLGKYILTFGMSLKAKVKSMVRKTFKLISHGKGHGPADHSIA